MQKNKRPRELEDVSAPQSDEVEVLRKQLKKAKREAAKEKNRRIEAEIRAENQRIEAEIRAAEERDRRIEAEKRAEDLRIQAEKVALQSNFINDLAGIKDRDTLLKRIEAADFNSHESSGVSSGSGTISFIRDNDSKATSKAGIIQMSKFSRKQVSETEDHMNVKLIEITKDNFLHRIKKTCKKARINDEEFVAEELLIIEKLRSTLLALQAKRRAEMCEQVVQMILILYATGMFERLYPSQRSVKDITGQLLQTEISVVCNGQIVKRRLHGKADVSIMVNSSFDASESEINKIINERSVTLETKFKRLDADHAAVASCTSQQLAQILAISKMRASELPTIVRSILTDFAKVRLAVGMKEGVCEGVPNPAITYYISTLSDDPMFLLGGLVLMQSKMLEKFIRDKANVLYESYDYGDEENNDPGGGDDAEDYFDDQLCEQGHVKSLARDFRRSASGPSSSHHLAGGGKESTQKRGRAVINEIEKENMISISMGDSDDDGMQELREYRKQWFRKWDCERLGQVYLSAENLAKQTSVH